MPTVSKAKTSAGTRIYVADMLPATYDLAGFTATGLTTALKEVGEITDLGSFGKKYNLVTFQPLGDRRVVKRRGSYNNGTLSLKMACSPADPGQVILNGASDNSMSFKVVTQSGNTYYFTGQVMGTTVEVGSVDQITSSSCDIEIDNDIVTNVLV